MNTMNKTKTVSPYFAFILLHSPDWYRNSRISTCNFKNAGYDAWISLIIAGIATHIVLFCMLKMLEKDGDLISIHTTTFGKWVGSIFSVIFTLYCLLFCLTVLRTYMEVIQVWIFPTIKLWKLTLMFY